MFTEEQRTDLSFTGISSFAKWSVCSDLDRVDADIAILGLPYDQSTQWRTGCRFGPRAIRDSSTQYALGPNGYYDPERDRIFLGNKWRYVDCGDVEMLHGSQEVCHENIRSAVRRLLMRDVLPVFLGGDHSVTAPVIEAFSGGDELTVIQLDAHLDFVDHRGGNRYGNGSPLRRAAECDHVKGIHHLGMRGPGSSGHDEFRLTKEMGNTVFGLRDIRRMGTEAVLEGLPENSDFYVTIDCDVLDPSIAPGCASPSPGGMYYHEIQDILESISRRGHVVGFDFVEVSPPYDVSSMTSQLAARLCLDFIGYILEQE